MSASPLPLRLLGSFQIGTDAHLTLRRKNRAILAYLALSPRALTRHELANIFCQSAADPSHTLRLSLSRLRSKLGQAALLYNGETVQFNPNHFQTDFLPFQSQLSQKELHKLSITKLEEVVSLYRGEFLEGLHLPDAPEFEMWLVGQRSSWRQLYERGAMAWLTRLIADKQYLAALPIAQKLLQQNPLLEEAHYHLIWLYAQTDQREAAVAQFKHCHTILQQELAVKPTPALQALNADILAGRLIQPREIELTALPVAKSTTTAEFVGREAELNQVQQIWTETAAGHGRCLLITAPAGGGKTRFVQELAPHLPDVIYLRGSCYESARALSYQPWIQILEALLAQSDETDIKELPEYWQTELSRLLPSLTIKQKEPAAEGKQEQLFAAVVSLLQQTERPLLLFIDDLQWADEASLQLFHFVLERMKAEPLLLLGAFRSEEAEENPALLTLLADLSRRPEQQILTLNPLTATAVNSLIAQLWPKLPDGYRTPHLRDNIRKATGGNPLFAIEIIRELAGLSRIPDELPVPPSLRDLIARRLYQLPASSRQVLESLAILDQPVYFDLAQQISGRSENETLQALEQGLRWHFLQTEQNKQIDFSHDLMRQGVWEQLNPIRRQLLHRRTAVVLSQHQAPAATLVYHWHQAGDPIEESKYAAQAGQEASDLYAYQEAVHYWQRALELSEDDRTRVPLLLALGQTLVVLGQWDEAKSLYEEGLRLTTDDHYQASLQASLAALLEYQGEYDAALKLVDLAATFFATQEDWQQLVRLLGYNGRIHWRQGQYEIAIRTYEQALAYAPYLSSERPLIRLHNNIGLVYWQQQQYEPAMSHFQQARQMAEAHQHKIALAISLGNIGNIHKDLGDYEQTLLYYEQALALDTELGNKMGMARHLGNIGVTYHNMSRYEEALTYYERALKLDEVLGHQEGVARHLGNIGTIYYSWGRYVDTLTYFARALRIDAELGNRAGVALHVGNMGSVYKMLGANEAATTCLVYASQLDLELGNKTGLARHLGNLADLYLQQSRLSEALAVCELAVGLLQIWRHDYDLCWNLWLKGTILFAQGVYGQSAHWFQRANEIAETVQRRDVLLTCQTQLPRARLLAGKLSGVAAQQQLDTLLAQTSELPFQAAILYEQWQLDKSAPRQVQANRAYQRLLQQSPTAEARQRAKELGTTKLPPTPAPPQLPALISDSPLDLESLLEKVKQILAAERN